MKTDLVLIRPVLTEKATTLAAGKVYMFEVAPRANKHQIKEALERLYKVKVADIKIAVRKGKTRRVGRKLTIKKLTDKKIAFIKLAEGKIDLFPQA